MNTPCSISETDKIRKDITPITKISSINKSAGEEYAEII
jgi:hypothetical protein